MRCKAQTETVTPNEVGPVAPLQRFVPQSRLANRWRGKDLGREFWTFLGVSFLFDSGMFMFFLLYNLYLLGIGFKEDFLGWIVGIMALGSIAGSLPAGLLTQRFGLRKTLLVCLGMVSVISGLRSLCTSAPWLLCLAFVGGSASALWAVSLPPIVAQLTNDRNRPFGFSLIFASGIAFGVMAGLMGGYLPKWLEPLSLGLNAVRAKQMALLFACGLTGLALLPASRLKLQSASVPEKSHFPSKSFAVRFFPALAIWSFATGAFSPFFNTYFSKGMGVPVERIGAIFSAAQAVQVLAIVLAPVVFRRFGLIAGILYTQLACAATMEWLSATSHIWDAAIAYACYSGLLWMSEPGIYALVMSKVRPGERSGASALILLVTSMANAASAAVAGIGFVRFGYPIMLTAIGGAIFMAAFVFYFLISDCELRGEPQPAAAESHCCE